MPRRPTGMVSCLPPEEAASVAQDLPGCHDPDARWLPLSEIARWDRNPRSNEEAIPKVAASIRRWGFVAPAVVWREETRLVAGHTRLLALESLLQEDPTFIPKGAPFGISPGMAPVRFQSFASEQEADAYALADNRLNEIATWDLPRLQEILLTLEAPLVELTGFDAASLATLDASLLVGGHGSDSTFRGDHDETPGEDHDTTSSGAPSIHYTLVFDTEAQQTRWFGFLRQLKETREGETHAARLDAFLEDLLQHPDP